MFDPLRAKARVVAIISFGFLGGLGLASGLGWTGPTYAMPTITQTPQVSDPAVQPALDLSDAFANVAETVTPAVVRIEVTSTEPAMTGGNPMDEFRRFFNMPQNPDMEEHPEVPRFGGGSGFLIAEDGYILTNNHVVENADNIRVYLIDGRVFEAEVVGTDPTTDVAVIKIPEDGLSYLSLGTSKNLRVGEWILAIGNPGFGGTPDQLDYTVTAGIVSAKGRPLSLIRQELQQNPAFGNELAGYAIEDFIQTDAVINRGNSGGPMVNLRGQVVGINSAIISPSGTYAGYGFAIPVDLASRVMEDLIEYGRVRRAWLGVQIQDVSQEDQEVYNLPAVAGVLVQEATDGGPAEDAGLQQGDVIYSVDGTVVYRTNGLQNLIAQKRPREDVSLLVYRDGSPMNVRVRLGEAPITATEERAAPTPSAPAEQEKLGIGVQELTSELARRMGYEDAGGVVITQVTPLGPASRRGIGPGAMILQVNGEPVDTPQDLTRILNDVPGGEVVTLLLGFIDGSTSIVNVRTSR